MLMFPRQLLQIARPCPKLVQTFSTACIGDGDRLDRQRIFLQRKSPQRKDKKNCSIIRRRFTSEANGGNERENQCNDGSNGKFDDKSDHSIKEEILDNALNYVLEHGWSRKALAMSANELGYPSVTEGMIERGGADLVLHSVKTNNDNLLIYMEQIKSSEEDLKVSAFIRTVLERRLRMLIPVISAWPQAMAILLRPSIVVEATEELGRMVDDIWYHAGDQSTDFNWYTKRGLLAKLFVSTQMVMIKDQSPDFRDTWEFLDRR